MQVISHFFANTKFEQYEDDIGPYLNTCKLLYKELLT